MGKKVFSQKEYNESMWSYACVEQNVNIPNHTLIRNPDLYGIDFLIYKNNAGLMDKSVGAIEVEDRGKTWRYGGFPFTTVHFLGRKFKFIGTNNFYVQLRGDGKDAVMIDTMELRKRALKAMDNRHVCGEKNWDIPLKDCYVGWVEINAKLNRAFNCGQQLLQ